MTNITKSTTDTKGRMPKRGGVGFNALRNEDDRLLRGKGQYLADIVLPGMLEVTFLRSPIAHGRIVSVEIPPEIQDRVYFLADLGAIKPIRSVASSPAFQGSDYPALADGIVRFVGEPIALCIGRTRAEAEDVAQAVLIDYDDLPVVGDMSAALEPNAPKVHDGWSGNVYFETAHGGGDIDDARARATVSVTRRYKMGRHAGVSLETRGVLAHYDNRLDETVVYSSTQFPHVIRTAMADHLGISERKLRVIAPDVGGGFGLKNNLQPEELAVTAASMKHGKPLRWIEDRREHLLASPHARAHEYEVTLHADAGGRILGMEAEVRVDAGAYSVWPWTASMEAGMSAGILTGPYDIPVYKGRAVTVATNKSPLGPYRGVGRTGAAFGIELSIDALARTLDIDPAELRQKNLVQPEQMPYSAINGKIYDSGDYPEACRRAAEAIGWAGIRSSQGQRRPDGRLRGVGMAVYTEQTAHGTAEWVARGLPVVFGYEPALARFTPDGELVLYVGIQCHGQGLETTLAQVAAERLGVSVDKVTVRHGDSSVSPYGMGTFASRSMVMAGGAVAEASDRVAEKIRRIGAHLLQVKPGDEAGIELVDDTVRFGDSSVSLKEIAQAAYLHPERLPDGLDPGLEGNASYQPKASTGAFSYACHACEVAVDDETGLIEIVDYVVVHDCGTMVNPLIVEGQVVGGVAQGIGTALYEEIPYDEFGNPLASTFMDYLIPGASEVPDVRVLHMETPSPHTRFGIKGMGEGGAIAPPAAIANAVNDAFKVAGIAAEIGVTPMTPDAVRACLSNPIEGDAP